MRVSASARDAWKRRQPTCCHDCPFLGTNIWGTNTVSGCLQVKFCHEKQIIFSSKRTLDKTGTLIKLCHQSSLFKPIKITGKKKSVPMLDKKLCWQSFVRLKTLFKAVIWWNIKKRNGWYAYSLCHAMSGTLSRIVHILRNLIYH